MSSIDDYAQQKLAELEERGLRRSLKTTNRDTPTGAKRGGKDLISFCCNDYLNLSHHPDVIAAAVTATNMYGTGSGGSRLISGNALMYEYLESGLAAFKGTEAALVFGSGYLTNIGVIPCFAGPGDLIIADELNHSCLHAGARISGAEVHLYKHADADDCARLLSQHRAAHRHCLILTDGVFSMDGDLAPLAQLSEIAHHNDAWLMVDDAHGFGVLGAGKGSVYAAQTPFPVPLQMGTLSKSAGAYGGYLCASQAIIDLVTNRARTFVYSTGLPPGTLAAAVAAIDIMGTETEICYRPVTNAQQFCTALGLPDPQSPIVPLVLGDADRVMQASMDLEAHGFLVTGIRPPTVAEGTARLRFTFTAEHMPADIDRLVETVKQLALVP
jgi:8-amino-7-oxononanoate synthase